MCLLILLFYCTCCVLANDFLTLTSPAPNQSLAPGHVLSFNYTMNAMTTESKEIRVMHEQGTHLCL